MSRALEILQEKLLARCAFQIGTDIDTLTDELNGHMTENTARRLAALLGPTQAFWIRLVNGDDDDA